jgi:beta-xylosidase
MRRITVILGILLCVQTNAQYKSKVWVSDQGDGTYQNPILYADYSDPDVIRVGDDYYMTASSFNCVPGLPILHSNDLVNWEIVNYAVCYQFANHNRHIGCISKVQFCTCSFSIW